MKQTAALETKDPNSYIPIYSPKRLGRMDRQQGERTHYQDVKISPFLFIFHYLVYIRKSLYYSAF